VTLNAVLLFVILFFVYPLKFVFGAIMERVLTHMGPANIGVYRAASERGAALESIC
jgi:hypothetical protein